MPFCVLVALILSSCYVLDNPYDAQASNHNQGSSPTTIGVHSGASGTTVPVASTPTTIKPTTTTVPQGRYEAESADYGGGTPTPARVGTGYSGYSGAGYLENFYPTAYVTFSVHVSAAGVYHVVLGYASVNGAHVNIYVNQADPRDQECTSTGSAWDNWGTTTIDVSLNEGLNTIKLQNDFDQNNLLNIDYIDVP